MGAARDSPTMRLAHMPLLLAATRKADWRRKEVSRMPDDAELLQQDELTKERTPEEMASWVDNTLSRFWATETTARQARLRAGLIDQFMGEIIPLSIFVNRLYLGQSYITCLPVIGSQRFDAIIFDNSFHPRVETKVEITNACFGYKDHLRMEHLNKHGGVFLTGDIKRIGERIEATIRAIDHVERLNEQFDQIRKAALRKLAKSYEDKPVLIVTFDDSRGFYTQEDSDFGRLGEFVSAELTPLFSGAIFRSAYILGLSGRVFLQIPQTTQGQ